MTFYLFRNTVNNCRLPGALFTNRDTFILYLIVNLKVNYSVSIYWLSRTGLGLVIPPVSFFVSFYHAVLQSAIAICSTAW